MARGDHPAEGDEEGTGVTSPCPLCPSVCTAGNPALGFLAGDDLSPGLAESWIWPWKLARAPGTVLSFVLHLEMCSVLPGQPLPCGKGPGVGARCVRPSVWAHTVLMELLQTRF